MNVELTSYFTTKKIGEKQHFEHFVKKMRKMLLLT